MFSPVSGDAALQLCRLQHCSRGFQFIAHLQGRVWQFLPGSCVSRSGHRLYMYSVHKLSGLVSMPSLARKRIIVGSQLW